MILKSEIDELSVAFKFRIDGYDYIVFASSETMKCFGCGREGHVRRACPEKDEDVAAEDGGVIVEEQVRDNAINGEKSTEHVAEQVNDIEIKETDGGEGEDLSVESSNVVEAAETVLEEGMDSDFGNEDEIFKTPSSKRKRAKANMEKARTSDKCDESEQSALDESDSEVTDTRGKQRSDYSFGKIRVFLQKTKNLKKVQVVDYFPDRRMFIKSVGTLMRGEGTDQFTVQEIYRLKKFVAKLRQELQTENGFETTWFFLFLSFKEVFVLFLISYDGCSEGGFTQYKWC